MTATIPSLVTSPHAGYLWPMLHMINAFFLSLTLVLTSFSMAMARGQNPDMGTDMVICTGVGMVTITIGADGEPVETAHICPDAMSIFAATTITHDIPAPLTALQWRVMAPDTVLTQPQETLSPSARGPPLDV